MAAYGLPFFCAFFFVTCCSGDVSGKYYYISLTNHINNVKKGITRYYNTILLLLLILLILYIYIIAFYILYIVFLFAKKNNK